jgi:hypothetical protein
MVARWRQAALGALSVAAGCAGWAGPAGACVTHDLGAFQICVPPDWALKKNGVDSAAGSFRAAGLTVSVDFGLNADPLRIPRDAAAADEAAVTLDGLPARQVEYTLGATQHYFGVHVPQVRSAAMGALKFTLLGEAADAAALRELPAVVSTIRFKPPPR